MKLSIVPARTGVQWVKAGVRIFLRQPLALAGLFFTFTAVMSVLGLLPVVGSVLALALLPGATLGFMAATEQASKGKFPMPTVLISAFRAGKQQLRAVLVLGGLYAAGFLLVLALSATMDGGKFARLYLVGGAMSAEVLQDPDFQKAVLLAMLCYTPLSMLFWHAPALVYWHGVSPVKSLFFSGIACKRNFWAYAMYGLVWIGMFLGMGMAVAVVATIAGIPEAVGDLMRPAAMLMAAMFFTSIYPTFRDSFEPAEADMP
jgi:hypothetical protein